jgi:sortase A
MGITDSQIDTNGLLKMHLAHRIRQLLLIVGMVLIGIYVAAYFHRKVLSRTQTRQFEDSLQTAPSEPPSDTRETLRVKSKFAVDFAHWSEKRITQYEESLATHFDPPLALLRISRFQLDAPVLEGTDDLTLNRGVGHIVGTALPGEEGNIGIAGHRDSFFRVLKDIKEGDTIELVTPRRTERYTVDHIVLVRPDDVSVLRPRPISSLTLVTCYPFYFIGSAPQRYIVQASIADSDNEVRKARLQEP